MDMNFAQKIRELRNKKGWSVYDLAEKIEKTAGYVSKIEARGEIPSPEMITLLAETFGIQPDELFDIAKSEKADQLTKNVIKKYDDELAMYRKTRKK
jgi:transcriptional regulator with XRE-family HTH domain